ncbi:MAG: GatB/YqeY domain-containing protein [Castellaniella sp.]|uniref:GatB/YqeY domain-containing protein n=1 Tax=Castellaniella sp. TaxID=1955812 RepID=UPI002A35E62C|nr:GatB/YqeY domain-containing protein [Castellaniella sp.]MDY0309829.1 GatB/YqeY domain-containing protein [Castellaniella sp.]
MSTELASQISDAVKAAMRARDSIRLGTLRLLQAAIKQKAVDERTEPDDAAILAIIEKQVKQRRESIAAFESAGRTDSANQERAELDILQAFLPQGATPQEISAAIDAACAQAASQGLQGGAAMGTIMGQLKKALAGRADMAAVSAQVRAKLNS